MHFGGGECYSSLGSVKHRQKKGVWVKSSVCSFFLRCSRETFLDNRIITCTRDIDNLCVDARVKRKLLGAWIAKLPRSLNHALELCTS